MLMRYGAFIGIIGGLASFIGHNHGLSKAMMGVVIGCILIGNRLPLALKELFDANHELTDEMEDYNKN